MSNNITQLPGTAKSADVSGNVNTAELQFSQRLTPESAAAIGKAYQRFVELSKSKIVTPNSTAEIAGLGQFLFNSFVAYAEDLLGCWNTTRLEYEPLVLAIARITMHTDRIRQQVSQINEPKS